ncbi:MAG TPA: hypothetical protein VFG68_10395 [Fimbriiglobus sp.]|nr:hypothetical protein [Fimbriiglobus sp.]
MTRLLWPLSVLLVCLPVAILATGVPLPFLHRSPGLPRPVPMPAGDQELAWFHTTTSGTTWERFVAGVERAQMLVPGLRVDDSAAFADQTTATPEVVLSMDGRTGRVRIRWYKLTNDATAARWVQALADRDPAPLAVIGGGSSDRAVDLARALEDQQSWRGDRPLLFITTATADEVPADADDAGPATRNLIDVYRGRSFRFCFTNRQMAEAVLDFVWATPGLRPQTFADLAPAAVASGLALVTGSKSPPFVGPHVFSVVWRDDPYSIDLHGQFSAAVARKGRPTGAAPDAPAVQIVTWSVPFSVGGFIRPNPSEAEVAASILEQFRKLPPQRSLLVLPTVTKPGRRLLGTLAASAPRLRQRLVVVTGDGIPVNAVYRDGGLEWPLRSLPVPLVLFAHGNPVGWDEPGTPAPAGYELHPPTATDDVLHFAEMVRLIAEGCYPPASGQLDRADDLAAQLHARCPPFFDEAGNRLGGTGETVVALWPHAEDGIPLATMEVWRRADDRRWERVRTVEVDQRRPRSGGPRE